MARQWPPSPSVEDEESALAREHALAHPFEPKSEDTPAGTRGTVDQYPIILDVDPKATSSSDDTSSDNERHSAGHSSDESLGPPTPTHSKGEQRYVYIPKAESKTSASAQTSAAAASQPGKKGAPRGRPNVSRIQTDLGGDLQEMITGGRRAPSPYAYTPANKPEETEHGNRFSGEFLLSPEHAKLPTIDHRRASSTRPRVRTEDLDSSTDSDRRPERRRHHSRKRSTRESFARAQPSLSETTVRPPKHDARTASGPDANPRPGLLSQGLQKEARDVRDAEETAHTLKKAAKESPYTSSAEESRTRTNRQHVSRTENKSSWDSPHTSSAEESYSKRRNPESGLIRPRRGSFHKRERPHLDLQSHHYSYGEGDIPDEKQESRKHRKDPKHHSVYDGRSYLEPSSLRSPKAAEDYFEKAFQDNVARKTGISPRPSPAASPMASPPGTPPRTPRPDRRSKDYFSLGASLPGQSPVQPRPRHSSKEEPLFKDLNPLTAAIATAAISKLTTEIPASLSRTSTSSAEKTSAGPASRTSSGRRSRNSSPTREDPKPTSRTNSFAQSDVRPVVPRAPTSLTHDVRPLSRTGSYALPQDQSPRHPQRAFSYSSADERPYQRLGHTPRMSQTNFLPVTVTETNVAAAGPRPARSSPSSPLLPVVNIVPKSLPLCPRSKPVAGYQDWHTIKEVPEIDICPTCMSSIGNSRFRDSFIPSPAKARNQETQCALSKPWIRNAWIQIMKQRRHSLDLIYQLIHLPPTTKPCPGKKGEVRLWYRIVDPETGSPVPNFEACSACVRGVEHMFPQLQGVFKRSAGVAERTCDLTCESKRFVGYMAQLDLAATRCDVERLREPNIQALADHARRTARVRECTRDDKIRSQPWHFIPQLPEFTICEECFQDVVWPVINKPIAGKINRTLQMLPGEEQHTNGVSCQLYSDRMRKVFLEAVQYNDFALLKSVATRRFGVEKLLQEKHRLLVRDMTMGIDRTTELQETIRSWMQWE